MAKNDKAAKKSPKSSKPKGAKQDYVRRPVKEAKIKALITKKQYSVAEAAELLPQISLSKFAGSCDLDVVLQLKDSQANESVRGSITFPNKFGNAVKVVVLAEENKVAEAKKAGADEAGLEEIVSKIEGGWLDFDVVIATPSVMAKIAKLGRVLGPRQLMPNPKTGTVTDDIENAVTQYKSGKTDFKMDAGRTIKMKFAKCDMAANEIAENLQTALDAIKSETKRFGLNAISRIYVTPTMGPSIEIV